MTCSTSPAEGLVHRGAEYRQRAGRLPASADAQGQEGRGSAAVLPVQSLAGPGPGNNGTDWGVVLPGLGDGEELGHMVFPCSPAPSPLQARSSRE